MNGEMWMFNREELGVIILLTEMSTKMERILGALGMEMDANERIQFLKLRVKAKELHSLTQPSAEEKVDEILSQ